MLIILDLMFTRAKSKRRNALKGETKGFKDKRQLKGLDMKISLQSKDCRENLWLVSWTGAMKIFIKNK